MSELMPFIVIGLTTGAVYGLAAVGLVLTYKTSGVFNFAHGALATAAAYCFFALHVENDVPWPVAAAVTITVVSVVLGLGLERLANALQRRPLSVRVASTVGVLLAIEALAAIVYDPGVVRTVPQFLAPGTVEFLDTTVEWSQIITFAFAAVATAGIWLVLRRTRAGLAMRAVVGDPDLLASAGTNPDSTRRRAWFLGVALAAASGVLFAPLLPLDPVQLTFLVVAAFGAAAIGSFSSLPLAFAGGLLIGVLASLGTKWFTSGILAGVPPSLPFLVLFLVLLTAKRGRLAMAGADAVGRRPSWTAPWRAQVAGGLVLLAVLATVPAFAGLRITAWTTMLATAIVFMSLWLLVRTSGQVSLCHVAFTAIGAAGFGRLVEQGLPWGVALLAAAVIAVPVGAVLAVPAIRLGGIYLALATFGFGVLLQGMFYTQDFMFGSNSVGIEMPRPSFAEGDDAFYYVVLVCAAATGLVVLAIGAGRLGRLLRGLADSPLALSTAGTDTNVLRVLVFCLSALLAAFGGALAGMSETTIGADPYQPLLSLTYFAIIMVVGGGPAWGAVLAAIAIVLVPAYADGEQIGLVLQLGFGLAAIALAFVAPERLEVPHHLAAVIDRLFRRPPRRPAAQAGAVSRGAVEAGDLRVKDLTVRFGGLVAVDDLSFDAPTGRITGLIGPNGAGKTTTFNACSGLIRPAQGRVALHGADVTRRGPASRARAGLGRTFQRMELFDSLTVRDNVSFGAEGPLAGANPLRHLAAGPGTAAATSAAAGDAMRLCGIEDLAERRVGDLSTGQRRLVELARCLAGPHRVLLLDEPSSGLDKSETERFGEVLRQVVEERGVGILLVEHDMPLVLEICDHIYVLDFGKLIFDGPPDAVVASPVVRAAYLGDHEGLPIPKEMLDV